MWEAIRANKRRSMALIFGLAALLVGLGYVIGMAVHPQGGPFGAAVAGFLWLILWITAITSGRQILLSSAGAHQVDKEQYPMLYNVVEEMSIAAGLPKVPRVFLVDNDAPNAFAVGTPENAAVAVTTGLMIRLNRDELQGVVAHEIGHIVNNDSKFMTLAGVMVAAIVIVADMFVRSVFYGAGRGRRRSSRDKGGGLLLIIALVFAILAPIIAQLLYFACSRKREYLADACSARFTRYPMGLASALKKIAGAGSKMKNVNRAVAPMYTVNPLKASGASSLLSTHPPTRDRIKVLSGMGGAGYAQYEEAYRNVCKDSLIGSRTLTESPTESIREPLEKEEKSGLEKAREALDVLHRANGYLFLSCVCGLTTKIPPSYERDQVRCPRCRRTIPIPRAMTAAAAAAALGASAQEEESEPEPPDRADPLIVQRKPDQWQSFRCECGGTVQLSPSFSAAETRCRSCGRRIRVESPT